MSPEDARSVRDYLQAQGAYQDELIESLGADREEVRRNKRLIWIWDFLSLGLCLGWEGRSVEGVTLERNTVLPWPFREAQVTLRTEGRRLAERRKLFWTALGHGRQVRQRDDANIELAELDPPRRQPAQPQGVAAAIP